MTNLSENVTRDRPPQKVLIGARLTLEKLQPVLEAHARYRAGRADGRRTVLLRCNLRGLDLCGIDLSGADLVECDFQGCNLTGARFEDATLTGSSFVDSLLNAARFTGADLSRADFHMADLRGSDLSEANLSEARLETAALGSSPESGLPTTIDTRILDRVMARRRRH
ncbi:pentapeptide repeat-containing protein [Pelagibius sp. CAU 1746]|uniref:pentapeptide repeat-containing protein n=1 Tax=Pelagibius sp. CAU 1746 TaxID=3140370 RepID=UPI00325B2277